VLAATATVAKKQAQDSEWSAQVLSTSLALDRGLALCEQGDVSAGILWLVRSLAISPPNASNLQHTIRANLTSWGSRVSSLRASLQHRLGVARVAFSPDGETVLTAATDIETGTTEARLWDAVTGQPLGPPLTHKGVVLAVSFNRNGRAVLVIARDKNA